MDTNPYVDALRRVEPGQTASFAELARLADRPKAARAAGRAIAALAADDPRPWHRVVQSDGALCPDPARAAAQIERLRKEGARPRVGEKMRAWARRRRAPWVGSWSTRMLLEVGDERVPDLDPLRVEAIRDPEDGYERGFYFAPPSPGEIDELKRAGRWGPDENLDPDELLGLNDPQPARGDPPAKPRASKPAKESRSGARAAKKPTRARERPASKRRDAPTAARKARAR